LDYYQKPSYNWYLYSMEAFAKVSEIFLKPKKGYCNLAAYRRWMKSCLWGKLQMKNLQHIKSIWPTDFRSGLDFIAKIHLPIHFKSSQIKSVSGSGIVRIFTLG